MRIVYEDEILQPPEKVFPWIADPEKAMKWQKNVKDGVIIKNNPKIIGTTFKEIIEENGKTLEMYGTITKYRKNRIIGFHIVSKIHEFDVSYVLERKEDTTIITIEATIHWKFPMNIFSIFFKKKIVEKMMNQLDLEVKELKNLCTG